MPILTLDLCGLFEPAQVRARFDGYCDGCDDFLQQLVDKNKRINELVRLKILIKKLPLADPVSPATDGAAELPSIVDDPPRFFPNTARMNTSCTSSCRTK